MCCPADLHSRVFDHHVEHRRAQPDGQEQDEQGGLPEEQPRYPPTQNTHSATSTRTRRTFRPAGINGGADLPADFLSEIYERITTNQIRARPLPGRNHPSTQRTPRQPQVRCTRRGAPARPPRALRAVAAARSVCLRSAACSDGDYCPRAVGTSWQRLHAPGLAAAPATTRAYT